MIITTTDSIEGRRIIEYKGLVWATAIRGVAIGKDLKAIGRNISGGRAEMYEDEADTGTVEALAELQASAEKLGANAVVGAAHAVYGIGNNGSMMLVTLSGTAVVVE
jgi:uncharacterized protein YbjQ (UPF0145 family)